MYKFHSSLLVLLLGLTGTNFGQSNPCEVKGFNGDIINYAPINGTLIQAKNINTINISITTKTGTFRIGDNLFSIESTSMSSKTDNDFILDTTNKKEIAEKVFKSSQVPECVSDTVKAKIEKGEFDLYTTSDRSVSLVKYRFAPGELDKFSFKTVYPPSNGISLVRELNKYYYINNGKKILSHQENDETDEYDFASDFHKGVALVGELVGYRKMKYYFINEKGQPKDTSSYCQYFSDDDFYFLKRTSDSVNQLYSKDGSLLMKNIDTVFSKSPSQLEVHLNGKKRHVHYINQVDTLKSAIRLFIKHTVLNDFILTDNIGKIFHLSHMTFTSPESLGSIFKIKRGNLLLMIDMDNQKLYDQYYEMLILEGDSPFYAVRKISSKWNLINKHFKELLENDYASISLKGSNLVAKKNSNGESARYILKANGPQLEGYYSELTQLDNWGYGFWLRKDKEIVRSGLYTNTRRDTFQMVNCVHGGNYPFNGNINYFGGFNKDQIAIVKGEYIDQAVMDKNLQFLLPFDCRFGYNNIYLQALQQGTMVKYEDKNHLKYSFLVQDGIRRSLDYTEIVPLNNASLFKVVKGSSGLNVGLINLKGDTLLQPLYYALSDVDSFGFLQVDSIERATKISKLIDTLGNWVTKSFYFTLKKYKLGFIAGKVSDSNWNIVDFKGVLIKSYLPYADIEILSKNRLLVTSGGGRQGVFSWGNKICLDTIYDSIIIKEGQFSCKIGTRNFIVDFIDTNGIPQETPRYISGDFGFYKEVLLNLKQKLGPN